LSQRSSHRATLAVVHAPFRPVGYVLVDAHLLLPAIWEEDPMRPAPGIGGLVAVKMPYGKLRPDLSPLTAYPPEPTPEPRKEAATEPAPAVPSVETAPPPGEDVEEAPVEEKSPEAEELEES
jgi:hypothetical protein